MENAMGGLEELERAELVAFAEWKKEAAEDQAAMRTSSAQTHWDSFSAGFWAAVEIAQIAFMLDKAEREHGNSTNLQAH